MSIYSFTFLYSHIRRPLCCSTIISSQKFIFYTVHVLPVLQLEYTTRCLRCSTPQCTYVATCCYDYNVRFYLCRQRFDGLYYKLMSTHVPDSCYKVSWFHLIMLGLPLTWLFLSSTTNWWSVHINASFHLILINISCHGLFSVLGRNEVSNRSVIFDRNILKWIWETCWLIKMGKDRLNKSVWPLLTCSMLDYHRTKYPMKCAHAELTANCALQVISQHSVVIDKLNETL